MDLEQLGQINLLNPEFQWVLNTQEFNLKQKGQSIKSPTFFANNTIQKMYLKFYPKGKNESDDGFTSLYLMNDNDYEITLDFTLSLLNDNNKKINLKELNSVKIESKSGHGLRHFLREIHMFDPTFQLIKDDKLSIVCKISTPMVINDVNKKMNNLAIKYKKLFTNERLSDVTVKCNGKEFKLHKSILASCSSVFESMFVIDMIEREQNIVEINDFAPPVLYEFFKYLYTNTIDNFKDKASHLLIVADKYLVSDLKEECEETMCANISLRNAMKYLKIAEKYNVQKLKSEVIKFIALNMGNFENSKEFDSLSREQFLEIIDCKIKLTKTGKQ